MKTLFMPSSAWVFGIIGGFMFVMLVFLSGSHMVTANSHPCVPGDTSQYCQAQNSGGGTVGAGTQGGGTVGAGTQGGGTVGTPLTVQLKNPLKYNTLVDFLKALLDILLVFAVPIIVFFLILSGFKFVMARGNESELSAAKTMFTWTVVGGVLVLGAWALVAVIQGTVNALR